MTFSLNWKQSHPTRNWRANMPQQFGLLDGLYRDPFMVIIQWFCDEGGKYKKDAMISLSGVGASPSRLNNFNDEWNALLRSFELSSVHMRLLADTYSAHGPKMPRDQTIEQRTAALLPFADCINKHLEIGLVQAWDVNAYVALPTEVKARLGGSMDPHYLAFVRGMLEMAGHLHEEDKISIIFDDDVMKAWDSYLHYRAICKSLPEFQKKFISLTFARDDDFPALQAADMVAFLGRLEANDVLCGKRNEWRKLFLHLTKEPEIGEGVMRWFELFADEQKLLNIANSLQQPLDHA